MDIEAATIQKVLETGDITTVLDAKVTPEWFLDDQHSDVFEYVQEHWRDHGVVPKYRTIKEIFEGYSLAAYPEPLSFYLQKLTQRRGYGIMATGIIGAQTALNNNPDDLEAAMHILSQALTRVSTEVTSLRDTVLNDTWEDRINEYLYRRDNPGIRGIPTGFPTIDKATLGLQPEQLVTFVGLPKAGKSTFLIRMAVSVQDYGKKVLFLSFEMSNDEQAARHDSMAAHVAQRRLLEGSLTQQDINALWQAKKDREGLPDFVLSGDISGATTVNGIAAKIERMQPDVVFVDGVYLMDDQEGESKGSPQALTNITRGLKRLAQKSKIPIVISTQVLPSKMRKKEGITQDAIGYSSSFAQDSDVILGVEADPEEADLVKIRVVIARNAPRVEAMVKWDWDCGTFEELAWEEEDDA